ncbi:MAG: ArsR family transcriptional regulator [Anaerolineales bacterium]|nr:ArsR family transcriptional regulator [Anaerolineales bacterium]
MQSTRQRILDHLEQRGPASPKQLAQAFGMSPANLRRHLSILQARGLVQAIALRPLAGRGRPEQVFTLTITAQPEGLENLTHALLRQLGDSPRAAQVRQLAANLVSTDNLPTGPARRLVTAMQRLTPLGYKPHWEARPQGPEVVLGRCPYANLVAEHPALCRMDKEVLEQLLGQPVEQVSKLQPGPDGQPQCIFITKN